jgi:hypothetical protein
MEWDEWDSGEEPQEYPRDEVIDEAKAAIERFFKGTEQRETVFYIMQLEVIFENDFYHWITYKAIDELVYERRLRDELQPLHKEHQQAKVRFIFHPSCRSTKRQIKRKLDLIRRFSAEDVSRGCGRYAEILFSRGLMISGFKFIAENTRQYQNRKWDATTHDLDYIFERDERAYGCEIKNRFEYMRSDEIALKIQICRHLGLIPLFIVRAAAKSYVNTVWTTSKGFTLIFQTHIYTEGHRDLVERIKQEFKGLPVDCPKDLPGSIVNRFLKWHRKQLPP